MNDWQFDWGGCHLNSNGDVHKVNFNYLGFKI